MATIYLKRMEDGTVEAFGDMEALVKCTGSKEFDSVTSSDLWEKNFCEARVEDGKVVLGPDTAGLCAIVRAERNRRLVADCDALSAMRLASMTDEERTAWAQYRQALLDIPQTAGFPWDGVNVPWPTKPGE